LQKKHPWISLVSNTSSEAHLPGAKIINAFYKGFESLDTDFDVICKYDADLIFPNNYLESLANHYQKNPQLGMVAGHCYIQKNMEVGNLKTLPQKSTFEGPLKAYRKACFMEIGGLKKIYGLGH